MSSLLITGGTGTFGKACIEYLLNSDEGERLRAQYKIERIVILSRDEYKQHLLKSKFEQMYGEKSKALRFFIGDVRDFERLKIAFNNVNFVIHAAAMKQVPACEVNPEECIKTNVQGTVNVVNVAIACNVSNVVLLSTDKAVEPINIYGACKMTGEKYGVFANSYSKNTKIGCVRYGNVVASRGSIIETFLKQSTTDRFTITDKDMTRFFMLPRQACELSFYALFNMKCGGETFVPYMKAYRIAKLVNLLDSSKEIKYIGVRPGEKINEILINQSEARRVYMCPDKQYYYVILPENNVWNPAAMKEYTKIGTKYMQLAQEDCRRFTSDGAQQYTDEEVLSLIETERTHIEV